MMRNVTSRKPFLFNLEDYKHVTLEKVQQGASWWACNACVMPSIDPWKSHAAMLPIIALIAPDVPSFVLWLHAAHQATGATPGSIYQCALQELKSPVPFWESPEMREQHDMKWSIDFRRQQMAEILNEVRNDKSISPESGTPGMFKIVEH